MKKLISTRGQPSLLPIGNSTPPRGHLPNDGSWLPYLVKKLCHAVLIAAVCMAAGYLLLVAVSCIPNRMMETELQESAAIISAQGNYPPVTVYNSIFSDDGFFYGFFLENITDADSISIACNQKSRNPFYNALDGFQLGETPEETFSLAALRALADGKGRYVGDHSQLWNGFRIWLRPLLVHYNVTEIHSITFMAATLLLAALCVQLARARGRPLAFLPFLFAVSVFNLQVESISLLFANDFCIALLACIALVWACCNGRERYAPEIFAAAGALVAFTSMLMLPLLTVGLPLVLWLTLKREHSARQKFGSLLCGSACWGTGWALTIGTKCLISMALFHTGTARERIQGWSGAGTMTFSERLIMVRQVLHNALASSTTRDFLVLTVLAAAAAALLRGQSTARRVLGQMLPALCVGVYPVVWCFVLAPHTGHPWTMWNYSIPLFAVLQTIWELWQAEPAPWLQNRKRAKIMPRQGGL